MKKNHPEQQELALFISRDLSAWRRLIVGRHVAGCAACRREAVWLREASEAFKLETDALPPGVSWDQLAGEMRANIRLGLEAGACVGAATGDEEADLIGGSGGGVGSAEESARPASWYSGWNPAGWWNNSRFGGWIQVEPTTAVWAASAAMAVLLVSSGIYWWQRGEAGSGGGLPLREIAAGGGPAAENGSDVVFRTTSDGIVVERAGRSLTLAHSGRSATALTVSLNGSMNAKYVDDDTNQVTIHHVYAE